MNEIFGDHNVDKQTTDSRGEVSLRPQSTYLILFTDWGTQMAYLMADISNVNTNEIKDLWQNLEGLSCK